MTQDAYIAREATSASPITHAEWLAVLGTLPDQGVGLAAAPEPAQQHVLTLPSGATTTLSLEATGMVKAENLDRDVMALLFMLAGTLEARVYSPRLRPYHSISDWERRVGLAQPLPPKARRRRTSRGFAGRFGIRLTRRHAVAAALGLSILAMSLALGLRAAE